jgi:sugar/nucleoside kinase (ribokinase family)
VITTGSILVDIGMRIPRLPVRGGDVLGDTLTRTPGAGFNLAAAVARQGVRCVYAGGVGTGPNGDLIRQALAFEHIEWTENARAESDSGSCFTLVEPDGERTFVTVPGAEALSQEMQLAGITVDAADIVAVSGYDLAYPESATALLRWLEDLSPDVKVALDLGPLVDGITADVLERALARADLLSLNKREAHLLSGKDDTSFDAVEVLAAALPRQRDGQVLIVRDGSAGGAVTGGPLGTHIVHVAAPRVDVVDTTGAGDAHTGVLLAELADGSELISAVTVANRAAAIAVTRAGAATAPTRAELRASSVKA